MLNWNSLKKMDKHLETAKKVGATTAKYGLTFCSGVLVGTICGVVLFFKISEGEV